MNNIWIVEDDAMYAKMLKRQIERSGQFEAIIFTKAEQILNGKNELPKAIFLDYQLPGVNGETVLKHIQALDSELPVIIVSGQENPTIAAELIKKGAYEYLTKTADTPRLLSVILTKLGKQIRMKNELEALRKEVSKNHDFADVLGSSSAVANVIPLLNKAAKSTIIVSLSGDTGVGKETVAKAIHLNSARATLPFTAVHLRAIPANEFDETFFGSFRNNEYFPGVLKNAAEGTLFIDELAELNIYNQAKLLQVLQKNSYTPVNGKETIDLACRIIVSTNKNLKELVKKGQFREDLYFKLLGLPIHIPSLKSRRSDVVLLANRFAISFCKTNKVGLKQITKPAQQKLLDYNWPGNVRELKAVIELACVMADAEVILPEDIRYEETSPSGDILSKERPLREYTAHIINFFLDKYEGDIPKVASKLDIGKSTIYRMIKNGEIKHLTK